MPILESMIEPCLYTITIPSSGLSDSGRTGGLTSLPLPSIPLTPDSKLRFNLQSTGMQTQSRWSIVAIGEKYVDRFDEVMEVVDRIHEDTQGLPFAIIVQTEEEIQIKNVTSHMTPALVGLI